MNKIDSFTMFLPDEIEVTITGREEMYPMCHTNERAWLDVLLELVAELVGGEKGILCAVFY